MAIQEFASGTASNVTTEVSLPSSPPRADDGVFQLVIDRNDMVEDDILVVRIKEKARTADTQRTLWTASFQQQPGNVPLTAMPALMLLHAWDMTLTADAGTITVPWSIRQVSTGITEHNSGSQTAVISTEHTLGTSGDATDGVYQLFVDVSAMTETDELILRLRETTISGGTKRRVEEWCVHHGASEGLWASPAMILLHGWDFTLTQTSGTGRAFPWSIRKAA